VSSVIAPVTGFALFLIAILADQLTDPDIAALALGLLLFQSATKRLKR
jgi:hypothetical protein